jgi:ubiquinone/menaquinone biosynthesis C-methylase UbiE
MNEFDLLVDMHKHNRRQGPGSPRVTKKAIELTGLLGQKNLRIADIGCGTGGQTLTLASHLDGKISAVDLFPEFLEILSVRASEKGLNKRITPVEASMDKLPFGDNIFDLIWSEGAIYIMGFEKGIALWKRHLKTGGILALSDITWTTDTRPEELEQFWERECPEIDTVSAKLEILENQGFEIIGHFVLPEDCWIDHYYLPLQESYSSFLERQGQSKEAIELIANDRSEFEMYMKYKQYYSYDFYIARLL